MQYFDPRAALFESVFFFWKQNGYFLRFSESPNLFEFRNQFSTSPNKLPNFLSFTRPSKFETVDAQILTSCLWKSCPFLWSQKEKKNEEHPTVYIGDIVALFKYIYRGSSTAIVVILKLLILLSFSAKNLANPWWSAQVGLFGMDPAADSPQLKQDHRQVSNSCGERSYSRSRVEEEEKETGEGVVEVGTKRPRGRPPGSKNKPKPPIFLDRDSPNSLRSIVLEVATGAEIANSISEYARRCRRGICVLSAKGSVTNVTLRQPAAPGSALALYGRFEILSLSGTLLPDPSIIGSSALTIYLAGAQGRVVGGSVVGSLVAAEPVIIIAATFSNANYQRLPIEEDDPERENGVRSSPPDAGIDQPRMLDRSPIPVYSDIYRQI